MNENDFTKKENHYQIIKMDESFYLLYLWQLFYQEELQNH